MLSIFIFYFKLIKKREHKMKIHQEYSTRTFFKTFWSYYKWNKVTSSCPIKYATRLELHNTTCLASKVHGTKRMFLRTFWWNHKWIRMMSPYHIQLQLSTARTQLCYNLTWAVMGCFKRLRKKRMFFRTFYTC